MYFNQQMHNCACVHMVEIDWKHWKIMKKVPFPSYTREAHQEKQRKKFCFSSWALREPLVRMMKKVLFYSFWSFSTMRMCAQACVCWLKYTTVEKHCSTTYMLIKFLTPRSIKLASKSYHRIYTAKMKITKASTGIILPIPLFIWHQTGWSLVQS